jgi:hypothetical protein
MTVLDPWHPEEALADALHAWRRSVLALGGNCAVHHSAFQPPALIIPVDAAMAQSLPGRGPSMILPGRAPRNSFCFAPKFDSPQRHDATGAFLPYMEAFRHLYGGGHGRVSTLPFDNHATAASEFATISAALDQIPGKLDAIVYFGHGEPFGMVSSDIYAKDIEKFAQLIKRKCVHGARVVLYACSCGKFNYPGGSFAARLAVALREIEAVVFGHDNVGHTVTNANIYRYTGRGLGAAVAPTGKFTAFDRMLKAESLDQKPKGNNAFWARIPFMTPDEIRAEVAR